ncbi:AGE family epimerase/isomerase [Phenylobacterium sp.]|jgi:mannose-6-phosphate isomerase|uniref:AGE family epimerase/isomerase n=1 Tax=Phenylobacterium sp. TaxID=1871053 RepID=UPI002F93B8D1
MLPPFQNLTEAAAWYGDWLQQAALPLWATAGVDQASGSFHEALALDGHPSGAVRRSRVQSRQTWVFATAAGAGVGDGYAAVAGEGWRFHQVHYQRPDGLFAFSADHAGQTVDATPALYEQAFSLLAMAALDRRAEAVQLREALNAMRHGAGAFRELGARPFQANALMHLFEAALAWEARGDESWRPLSDELAELALNRFIDAGSGFLREFYDEEWRPLDEHAGGLVEPGHQFEWAWLLDRWSASRGREDARQSARRLYSRGLMGVDLERQVAVGAIWSGGQVREPLARLWAQTEFLRAALTFGTEAEALMAARGLARFLDTPVRGLWRDKMRADGSFVDEPAPATSLYHLVAGLLPLIQRG